MRIGVVKEIKPDEHRVALTPVASRELVRQGHQILVEHNAGEGSGFPDDAYRAAGADVLARDDVWGSAELLLKVKEPLPQEYPMFRTDLTLFTYLHLAASPELAKALLDSGATCIAYETVETADGRLPLLIPMSQAAGRLAAQVGAVSLQRPNGGRGVILAGLPGVPPAKVVVLGGGIVGYNAALIAVGMRADVWIVERSIDRIYELEHLFGGQAKIAMPGTCVLVEDVISGADLVIGSVLIPGARAPRLVTREMLPRVNPGGVLVDVAIDQGGCFETSRPTTHSEPTYEVDGVVHYCVPNMPGAVPISSTLALTNVTLPYVSLLAEIGVSEALRRSPALAKGVNVMGHHLTNRAVADSIALPYTPLGDMVLGVAA